MPRTLQELQEFAKTLTLQATKSEMKLHKELVKRNFNFKFQHIIAPFICDFYFPESKSIIELDGKPHKSRVAYDASRDLYLKNAGYSVYRIKSYRVFQDFNSVLDEISSFISGIEVKHKRKTRQKRS